MHICMYICKQCDRDQNNCPSILVGTGNVAFGRHVSGSSNDNQSVQAVDGNLDDTWSQPSCSRMYKSEKGHIWWEIDMSDLYNIAYVRITNTVLDHSGRCVHMIPYESRDMILYAHNIATAAINNNS